LIARSERAVTARGGAAVAAWRGAAVAAWREAAVAAWREAAIAARRGAAVAAWRGAAVAAWREAAIAARRAPAFATVRRITAITAAGIAHSPAEAAIRARREPTLRPSRVTPPAITARRLTGLAARLATLRRGGEPLLAIERLLGVAENERVAALAARNLLIGHGLFSVPCSEIAITLTRDTRGSRRRNLDGRPWRRLPRMGAHALTALDRFRKSEA
jgi:hypothetical protein